LRLCVFARDIFFTGSKSPFPITITWPVY